MFSQKYYVSLHIRNLKQNTMDLKQYIADINQQYQTGMAREHAYRPALKDCKRITLSSEDEKLYKQIIYMF